MSSYVREQLASAQLVTMRELNQHTADVIREINEKGTPALITRHGRFVAMLTPLAGTAVESAALSAVIEAAENKRQLTGEHTLSQVRDPGQVADELGLALPPD